jgi:hypothetical protein
MLKVAEFLRFVLRVDLLKVFLKHVLLLTLHLLLGHGVGPSGTLRDVQNCTWNIDVINAHLKS